MNTNVKTVLLAGGKGTRLEPLTRDRAKPAVPYGGIYRIVDFTLSNCVNSRLHDIIVLTQFKSRSLDQHIKRAWNFFSHQLNHSLEVLPPQQRLDEHWYLGTADALYQNIYSIEPSQPDHILILAGDHIYRMDYNGFIQHHVTSGADLTIGCIPVPIAESDQFGIVEADDNGNLTAFHEKPAQCEPMAGSSDHALGSMGIYLFRASNLYEAVCRDAADAKSRHDFGHNIIPSLLDRGSSIQVFAHQNRNSPEAPYWRDVGTLDAYFDSSMELLGNDPKFQIHDPDWPTWTLFPELPPARIMGQCNAIHNSLIGPGSTIDSASISQSVLSHNVIVKNGAVIENSIIFPDVTIESDVRIRNAIVDRHCVFDKGTRIGHDVEHDRARQFSITALNRVIVPRGETIRDV